MRLKRSMMTYTKKNTPVTKLGTLVIPSSYGVTETRFEQVLRRSFVRWRTGAV